MTEDNLLIKRIAGKISGRLDSGFKPDMEALHFLKTSYGVNDGDEILEFLSDAALNDGTIYELTVYPDDRFRLEIERIIPAQGITPTDIEVIIAILSSEPRQLSLITPAGGFLIDRESVGSCVSSFIKKLNLELDLGYLGDIPETESDVLYYSSRALLRRRRFSPAWGRGDFMRMLIQQRSVVKTGDEEIPALIERGISLLSGTEGEALDALAAKKYYYESVISRCEEFASLLKSWGMEFLMMKKIQPPAVSVDEAIESIKIIDRLTSMVYGMIIPSSDRGLSLKISHSDSPSDIFDL